MNTRIVVNGNTAMGELVLSYVRDALELQGKGARLLAALNSMSLGDDWAHLAVELGLPVPGTGEPPSQHAQDLWAIISTGQSHIAHPAVGEYSRIDQG